jgi:hypothetical protein
MAPLPIRPLLHDHEAFFGEMIPITDRAIVRPEMDACDLHSVFGYIHGAIERFITTLGCAAIDDVLAISCHLCLILHRAWPGLLYPSL